MAHGGFDTTIALSDRHLNARMLSDRKDQAVPAIRDNIERMDGAGWIDPEAQSYPPGTVGCVVVYPPGRCVTADRLE